MARDAVIWVTPAGFSFWSLVASMEADAMTLQKTGRYWESVRAFQDAKWVRDWFNHAFEVKPDRDFIRFILADALVGEVGPDDAEHCAANLARLGKALKTDGGDQLAAAAEIRQAIAMRK